MADEVGGGVDFGAEEGGGELAFVESASEAGAEAIEGACGEVGEGLNEGVDGSAEDLQSRGTAL